MPVENSETSNDIVVHDVKWDFFGQRIATASSDHTVKIIGLSNDPALKPLATLTGHQGPVLQVAWAHPRFGSILASCSNEGRVIIWKEGNQNEWKQVHVFQEHKCSFNCIAWAPHELMLCLACGSSDGSIAVLTDRLDGGWDTSRIGKAHPGGVASVSWAPAVAPGAVAGTWVFNPVPKLASGGCDSTMKMWKLQNGTWKMDCLPAIQTLQVHSDLVKDVASVPNVGPLKSTIASPAEDHDASSVDARRNYYWSVEEDELLIKAWLNTSKDLAAENDRENLAFWRRIEKYYEENRKVGLVRVRSQLNSRWYRVSQMVKKFLECYNQASQECQGEKDEKEIITKAHKLYRSQNDGHSFQLEHAWMLLKDEPKWKASINMSSDEGCSKRMKVSESGACMSSSNPDTITRAEGSSEACDVDPNIEPVKKPVKGNEKAKDERKLKGALTKELHGIKSAEVKKAVAMEELARTKQMEIDMQIIYKDTSSMNEEQLQFHVQLVQKLKQKYLM